MDTIIFIYFNLFNTNINNFCWLLTLSVDTSHLSVAFDDLTSWNIKI